MRARRSCSHTDVRSAPKRRFAPMQNDLQSRGQRRRRDVAREGRAAALEARSCRSVSPLACARSSASVKACPTEAASLICCGDGSFSQPMTSTPIGSASARAGRARRAACRDTRAPPRTTREISATNRGFSSRNSASGIISGRPGIGRQAIDAERRGGLQGVAAAGELKNDGAAALDGGHGMMMEHREQVAQPVRGREGLEQAGLAWHGVV